MDGDKEYPFLIHSLPHIGIRDPFLSENEVKIPTDEEEGEEDNEPDQADIPQHIDDLVYANSRYKINERPVFVYFPSAEVLFKIMRACIGIEKEEDLWFNTREMCQEEHGKEPRRKRGKKAKKGGEGR